ncbi:Rho-type GTPase activating protein, with CRAL-TRIO_domain Rga10 [Schizosaccharomyces osmophilus]|uniref:Rho-type GTPase activating protein, with CRAL-TRIO_domain Rga10 n=1 Tax=Schizosaccharomyces osmophilus TaxID=2545709 RepID=A0AAE9WE21_9SCHI|nr:Rho-type GTPase activating protein, with CRAL-TRIO_domain Rga10 [Schizosaccharomyces osmophilus]WBW73028.1 Rho-type GTPase activating protein, with CRAL-TRIO_domain Rga10 [Schizosaccharomyces osmophilus]
MEDDLKRFCFVSGVDNEHDKILVVVTAYLKPLLDSGDTDIIQRMYNRAHELVFADEKYTAVFFSHESNILPYLNFCAKAYLKMDYYLHKHAKAVHVVHSDWLSRMAIRTLLSFVSPKFYQKFHYSSSLSHLAKHLPLRQLKLPVMVYEFDRTVEPRIFSNASVQQESSLNNSSFHTPIQNWSRPPDALIDACRVVRNSLDVQGLFRRSCSKKHLDILIELYENQCTVDLESFGAFSACALIKHIFRSTSIPLFSNTFIEDLSKAQDQYLEETKESLVLLREFVEENMDENSQKAAKYIFSLLSEIDEHQDENLMNSQNLVICMGPSFLQSNDIASLLIMKEKESGPYFRFLQRSILHWREIFTVSENWDVYW